MKKLPSIIFPVFYWIKREEDDDTAILLGVFSSRRKASLFKNEILLDQTYRKIIKKEDIYIDQYKIDSEQWVSGFN